MSRTSTIKVWLGSASARDGAHGAESKIRRAVEMRSSGPQRDHRRNAVSMVAKKRLPSLARRSSPPNRVLGNRRLPDLDAKLEEFAADPWSAPERVGDADVSDRIDCLTPAGAFGRPPPGCDFHRRYKRKPARCQRITVSGLSTARALSTSGAKPYSPTNSRRSIVPMIGRFGELRRRILSWWRSTSISISSEARDRNNPISPYQITLQARSSSRSFTRFAANRQSY